MDSFRDLAIRTYYSHGTAPESWSRSCGSGPPLTWYGYLEPSTRLILPAVSHLIFQIHLSLFMDEDRYCWHRTKMGEYIVRSGNYSLLETAARQNDLTTATPNFNWIKLVWNVTFPETQTLSLETWQRSSPFGCKSTWLGHHLKHKLPSLRSLRNGFAPLPFLPFFLNKFGCKRHSLPRQTLQPTAPSTKRQNQPLNYFFPPTCIINDVFFWIGW